MASRASLEAQNAALLVQMAALTEIVKGLRDELAALRVTRSEGEARGSQRVVVSATTPATAVTKATERKPKGERVNHEDGKWTPVKRKKRQLVKKPESGDKTELSLRADDWNVPVNISDDEFTDKGAGISVRSQADGERIFEELKGSVGRMAVVTPKAIEAAETKSTELQCKMVNDAGRLIILKRYLTLIGDKNVKALYLAKENQDKQTLAVGDASVRVVFQMCEKHMSETEYKNAKKSPRAALMAWLEKHELNKTVLYMTQPYVKSVYGNEWIEGVASIRKDSLPSFLKISGEDGGFTKQFLTADVKDDSMRIIWFEENTTLADARSRSARYKDQALGLVSGRRGLGVRVLKDNFNELAVKILGDTVGNAEVKKQGQKIFEITKVPVWVDFKDVRKELRTKLGWDVTHIRDIPGWNAKTFIVGASETPAFDHIVVDQHWIPIQPARERKAVAVKRWNFKGQENGPQAKHAAKPATVSVTQAPIASRPSVPTSTSSSGVTGSEIETILKRYMEQFDQKIEKRLQEFQDQFVDDESEDDDMEEEGVDAADKTAEKLAAARAAKKQKKQDEKH